MIYPCRPVHGSEPIRVAAQQIVWTDTLQTTGMLLALVACVAWLLHAMDLGLSASLAQIQQRGLAHAITTSADSPVNFWKQVVAGIFIVIAMTGMDQEMMQKNISVRTLRDSQKNMLALTAILVGCCRCSSTWAACCACMRRAPA